MRLRAPEGRPLFAASPGALFAIPPGADPNRGCPLSLEVTDIAFQPAPETVPLTEWRALFHDSPLAIAYVSHDLRLLRVNGPFAVLCGRMAGELLGRHCYEVFGEHALEGDTLERPKPCSFCRARETLRTGEVAEFDRPFGQATLRVVASPVGEHRGKITGAVLMIANVTAERELRRQLVECQRLASVGTMTSSVAHELKNPLTCILGFAQLLRQDAALPEAARAHLGRIWNEARRCDHIVAGLLKFTRRRDSTKAVLDVNQLIAESLGLLHHPIQTSRVRLHESLHHEPLPVLGHFCELQQVVQNIVNNALDALRDARQGGNLTLRTFPRDSWAVMEFENDGPRFAEPHRLFQPFYTTKGAGQGTGLGLCVSDAIVRDHGGRIEAINMPQGVMFRIALPKAP
ncbi:MAG: PAS domain S-box protein [Planctomycetes bacterium]|nr:PAS domain S-box protein [Planctomycetota bacterium]